MKKIYLFVFFGALLVALLAGCKKDEAKPASAIEFDMDGVHYNKPVSGAVVLDTAFNGTVTKSIEISSPMSENIIFAFAFADNQSSPSDNCITPGTYRTIYTSGCNDTLPGICQVFSMVTNDMSTGGLFMPGYDDSLSVATVSSCSNSFMNGTFSCTLVDALNGTGIVKHVTNGKIKDVKITR
jgi:hypothetical protein